LKQRMFRENEKDIGKTTVDSWGHEPRRRPGYATLNLDQRGESEFHSC
jgi:hypothetical protein